MQISNVIIDIVTCYIIDFFRFKKRIFIAEKSARQCLTDFVRKGFDQKGFIELLTCLSESAPCLIEFLNYLRLCIERHDKSIGRSTVVYKCPEVWSDFVYALASPSPVCALIRPTTPVLLLFKRMIKSEDLRHDPEAMKTLQHEVPVVYKLLCSLSTVPPSINLIFRKLSDISLAPFNEHDNDHSFENYNDMDEDNMAYFPNLPKVRRRRFYSADQSKTGICTKKSYGHPTLLPGVFTLYCSHGKNRCFS